MLVFVFFFNFSGGHVHFTEDSSRRNWLILHLSNIRTIFSRRNDFGMAFLYKIHVFRKNKMNAKFALKICPILSVDRNLTRINQNRYEV